MAKFINKKSSFIGKSVKFGKNVTIYPNVVIEGTTYIGDNTTIYNGSYIIDSIIGSNNTIYSSHIFQSKIGSDNIIGPYAHIRENNIINNNVKIGSFVEIKKSIVLDNSKIPHLSYIGDAEIGSNVNIGCGVITANYDGENKHKTIINDNAFIGCNSNLVAPVEIGKNTFIAAWTTVTKNVGENEFAISRVKQENKKNKKVVEKWKRYY